MKKIMIPNISQEEICNSFKELKYKDRIIEKSKQYSNNIVDVEKLYNDEVKFIENDKDYLDYMKNIYKNKLSNKGYPYLYQYYDKIKSAQNVCPYCNFYTRQVRQLDHFLPKSVFPSLSISVNNLVPICKDCNELKGNYFSKEKSKQLIHPYYGIEIDDIFEFLKCSIIEDKNIGFKFHIKKLDKWTDDFYYNILLHFEKLKIDALYLSEFEAEFSIVLEELIMLYEERKNEEIVYDNLKRKVDLYFNKKIMPWRYAGFQSILNCKWFFNTYITNLVGGK